jgi:A/G-specific adenine glycosylase
MATGKSPLRPHPQEATTAPWDQSDMPHLGRQSGRIRRWFSHNGRQLPWRQPPRSGPHPGGWGVLVSEFMLQQTPVARVLPVWSTWLERWPSPAAQAADPVGVAIRAWGRLGYPRRALRLHAAAEVIARDHDDLVPAGAVDLRALPGVGDYTTGAVLAFAYGQRAVALDTNVRRVIARHDLGREVAGNLTAADTAYARQIQPRRGGAEWMAAVMELGALVCTARNPSCGACPVSQTCRWLALGAPRSEPTRRQPSYTGSDRQARGVLLGVLRDSEGPVDSRRLDLAWPDARQRLRALDGLVADGLVVAVPRGRWALPE